MFVIFSSPARTGSSGHNLVTSRHFAVAENDEVAEDVGIDGGAASAEEAAVHIVES